MKKGRPSGKAKARELIVLARRRRVGESYIRGTPQWKIAEAEKVSQSQITNDLAAIRDEWKAEQAGSYDVFVARELTRIDRVEAQAWEAWERSKLDAEIRTAKTVNEGNGPDGKPLAGRSEASKRTEGQAGDPSFLRIINECCDRRCKILGLFKRADDDEEQTGPRLLVIEIEGAKRTKVSTARGSGPAVSDAGE